MTAAKQETMMTRRTAMETAPVASSYADDARPPVRCATLPLLGIYLTLEWVGSQHCNEGMIM